MKAFYVMFVVFVVLLLAAPTASAQEGWPGCPWGAAYDPMVHGYMPACFSRPAADTAAPKAARLTAPAPTQEQFLPCGPSESLDPLFLASLAHGYVPECLSQPIPAAKAASKPSGLAAPAPAQEQFVPCSFVEGLDPLLDPLALACLTQSIPAAKAASKPAGLAAPAPAAITEQVLSCQMWGDAAHNAWSDADYNPMLYGSVPECVSRPADNAAAPKPAGLAAPAPTQEQFGPCGAGESLDPLFLVCLSQPDPAAKTASKPAGLAAPAPAQEQFGPCGSSGESPDPLAWPLACMR